MKDKNNVEKNNKNARVGRRNDEHEKRRDERQRNWKKNDVRRNEVNKIREKVRIELLRDPDQDQGRGQGRHKGDVIVPVHTLVRDRREAVAIHGLIHHDTVVDLHTLVAPCEGTDGLHLRIADADECHHHDEAAGDADEPAAVRTAVHDRKADRGLHEEVDDLCHHRDRREEDDPERGRHREAGQDHEEEGEKNE